MFDGRVGWLRACLRKTVKLLCHYSGKGVGNGSRAPGVKKGAPGTRDPYLRRAGPPH